MEDGGGGAGALGASRPASPPRGSLSATSGEPEARVSETDGRFRAGGDSGSSRRPVSACRPDSLPQGQIGSGILAADPAELEEALAQDMTHKPGRQATEVFELIGEITRPGGQQMEGVKIWKALDSGLVLAEESIGGCSTLFIKSFNPVRAPEAPEAPNHCCAFATTCCSRNASTKPTNIRKGLVLVEVQGEAVLHCTGEGIMSRISRIQALQSSVESREACELGFCEPTKEERLQFQASLRREFLLWLSFATGALIALTAPVWLPFAFFNGLQCHSNDSTRLETARKWIETVIGAAPAWCRTALLTPILTTIGSSIFGTLTGFGGFGWPSWWPAWCPIGKSVAESTFEQQVSDMDLRASQKKALLLEHRKVQHQSRSLGTIILTGHGIGAAPPPRQVAGWASIAGDDNVIHGTNDSYVFGSAGHQATWSAQDALMLTRWQAISVVALKLTCWHWSQPVVYCWVFFVYFCTLSRNQQIAGSIIGAREAIYLISTLIALVKCPSFLLLDMSTVWCEEGTSRFARFRHVAMYLLTPHIFVSLCIANSSDMLRKIFVPLTACEVIADFASCFALGALLSPGSNAPTALIIGYAITALGFTCFFGPLMVKELWTLSNSFSKGGPSTVDSNMNFQTSNTFGTLPDFAGDAARRAAKKRREKQIADRRKCLSRCASLSLLLGLVYVLVGGMQLASGVDIYCTGYTGSVPDCSHGRCFAGQCRCIAGFTGANCDIRDPCALAVEPCCSGGSCGPHWQNCTLSGGCSCAHNYAGTSCQLDCGAHGSSISSQCECYEGYSGDHCQTIDPCAGVKEPCCGSECGTHWQNCTSGQCTCAKGYFGERCSQSLEEGVVVSMSSADNMTKEVHASVNRVIGTYGKTDRHCRGKSVYAKMDPLSYSTGFDGSELALYAWQNSSEPHTAAHWTIAPGIAGAQDCSVVGLVLSVGTSSSCERDVLQCRLKFPVAGVVGATMTLAELSKTPPPPPPNCPVGVVVIDGQCACTFASTVGAYGPPIALAETVAQFLHLPRIGYWWLQPDFIPMVGVDQRCSVVTWQGQVFTFTVFCAELLLLTVFTSVILFTLGKVTGKLGDHEKLCDLLLSSSCFCLSSSCFCFAWGGLLLGRFGTVACATGWAISILVQLCVCCNGLTGKQDMTLFTLWLNIATWMLLLVSASWGPVAAFGALVMSMLGLLIEDD